MLPDGDDDMVAAASGIAGVAGWHAVQTGELQRSERVLVLGASGTVGWWRCRRRGCWARAGSWQPAATAGGWRARELGADAVVELGERDDLEETFRGAFPDGGPEVVIDPLWGSPAWPR